MFRRLYGRLFRPHMGDSPSPLRLGSSCWLHATFVFQLKTSNSVYLLVHPLLIFSEKSNSLTYCFWYVSSFGVWKVFTILVHRFLSQNLTPDTCVEGETKKVAHRCEKRKAHHPRAGGIRSPGQGAQTDEQHGNGCNRQTLRIVSCFCII